MKLIIEIPEEVYKTVQDGSYCGSLYEELKAAIPYNPSGDLISREALKEEVENLVVGGAEGLKGYYENGSKADENSWIGGVYDAWELINSAPTIELSPVINMKPLTAEEKQGLIDALKKSRLKVVKLDDEGIRGECRTCRHRDPEDKKCDCGELERRGCLFRVSDDYYCKFYEKGGAE